MWGRKGVVDPWGPGRIWREIWSQQILFGAISLRNWRLRSQHRKRKWQSSLSPQLLACSKKDQIYRDTVKATPPEACREKLNSGMEWWMLCTNNSWWVTAIRVFVLGKSSWSDVILGRRQLNMWLSSYEWLYLRASSVKLTGWGTSMGDIHGQVAVVRLERDIQNVTN